MSDDGPRIVKQVQAYCVCMHSDTCHEMERGRCRVEGEVQGTDRTWHCPCESFIEDRNRPDFRARPGVTNDQLRDGFPRP